MSFPVVDGLILWMGDSGVPHRVTSTYRPDPASFHSQGLAVDFAGPEPSVNSPELREVYRALRPLGPLCLELIYAGPGGGFWKNGQMVEPYSVGGHQDHVHIAMPAHWRYEDAHVEQPSGPHRVRLRLRRTLHGLDHGFRDG